jgi:hypothetical protein
VLLARMHAPLRVSPHGEVRALIVIVARPNLAFNPDAPSARQLT